MIIETQTNFLNLAPNVTFEVQDRFLIANTLASSSEDFVVEAYTEDIIVFQNKAWEINKIGYELLAGMTFPHQAFSVAPEEAGHEAKKLIDELIETSEYLKVKEQAELRCDQVQSEWKANLAKSTEALLEITGIDFSRDNYQVFVTHPSIRQGRYLGNNQIAWGGQDHGENYSTIYIWHEILHADDKLGTDCRVKHAIIELVTDIELRKKLNNQEHPPFQGHSDLDGIRDALLDDWRTYLKNSGDGILRFADAMKEKFEELEGI